jgi:hypothetical protein
MTMDDATLCLRRFRAGRTVTIQDSNKIDSMGVHRTSGEVWLTISDHLPWTDGEGEHLLLLQEKLDTYLRFVESGEVLQRVPDARDRTIVMHVFGKYPLSEQADSFYRQARSAIEAAGFRLQFTLVPIEPRDRPIG